MSACPSLEPYAALVALAEREELLVGAGAWEDLPALAGERDALVAALPSVPPAEALPHLERLAALQALSSAALARARTDCAGELARLGGGRTGVRGYAAAASTLSAAAPSIRLDGSA